MFLGVCADNLRNDRNIATRREEGCAQKFNISLLIHLCFVTFTPDKIDALCIFKYV